MTKIGFVLLTHDRPEQVRFLCERLNVAFERPPIACHHDFGQTALDQRSFPGNVMFVRDWERTRWGGWGVVAGQLKALRMLYERDDPDWFVVLSGADYPIKRGSSILNDLEAGGYDAYLDHRRIQACDLPLPVNGWGNQNFIHPAWVRLAFERYMAIGFGFYKLATRFRWRRKAFFVKSRFFIETFTPFNGSLDCYAGDFWLTANRKAATALLANSRTNRELIAHFRKRANPDEGFHHTLLCNTGLRISTDNKRFTDWEGGVNHPRTLGEADFQTLLASTDHFARKFAFEPEVLRKLDAAVDSLPQPVRETTARY